MTDISEYIRYWPYGAAALIGAVLAVADRRWLGGFWLGGLLVLVVVAGAITMRMSPFTFQGGDHYFEGLIAMLAGGAGLAGYCAGLICCRACARGCRGRAS